MTYEDTKKIHKEIPEGWKQTSFMYLTAPGYTIELLDTEGKKHIFSGKTADEVAAAIRNGTRS